MLIFYIAAASPMPLMLSLFRACKCRFAFQSRRFRHLFAAFALPPPLIYFRRRHFLRYAADMPAADAFDAYHAAATPAADFACRHYDAISRFAAAAALRRFYFSLLLRF